MAAARLCCTAPLRSESPDDVPSRPVRHFKSLANIKTHFAHNKHTSTTINGITDENHPLYPADDLELQRIFVTASLPEDHPDALRIGHRKPTVDDTIIRSPSFTNKLRRQLSCRSLVKNKPDKEATRKHPLKFLGNTRDRKASELADIPGGYDEDAQSLCLTESTPDNDASVMTSKSTHVHVSSSRITKSCMLAPDEPRRSTSVPPTPGPIDSTSQPSTDARQDFKCALTVQLPGPAIMDANEIWPLSPSAQKTPTTSTTIRLQPSSMLLSMTPSLSRPMRAKSRSTDKQKIVSKDSTISLHLHDMQISQHLRTRSQLSDASATSDPDRQNRKTHASLNSIVLSSWEPARCKSISSTGFTGSIRPSTWEQVLEDESSSIYSRRTSTAQEEPLISPVEQVCAYSVESMRDSLAPHIDPELSPHEEDAFVAAERVVSTSTGISVLLSRSGSQSEAEPSTTKTDPASTSGWPTCSTACSLPKSDSSGSLGKLSKFKEDLSSSSTATMSAKKRRSVLHILFPRLARPKFRNPSTPLLNDSMRPSFSAVYDGPGDAQDLLSVPQPSSRLHDGQRTVSFTGRPGFGPARGFSSASSTINQSSQSRQSLVNYERSLSIAGDDRRRESALGRSKSRAVDIEDSEDSGLELYRASPLARLDRKGTEEGLMEKALQQHQLEKAALLRPSKAKLEVAPTPRHAPLFRSPFGFPCASEASLSVAAVEDLDPLEAERPHDIRKSQSMQDLGSSQILSNDMHVLRKKKRSTIWTMNTATTKGTRTHHHAMTPPRSWSRYPSHTRERRCGSAGRHDSIVCRDFAYLDNPRQKHHARSQEEVTSTPKSWPRLVNAKRRNWIVKSRSMTFGTVLRYYTNLLTSSAARNRRSSTATGGRLEHPELEVLPPMLPPRTDDAKNLGAKDRVARFVDHVKEERHHAEEGHELFDHPEHQPPAGSDAASSMSNSPLRVQHSKADSVHDHPTETMPIAQGAATDEIDPLAVLDGGFEGKLTQSEKVLGASRLSRMYQAYVQLPASLDNTEVERSGVTDDSLHVSDGQTTAGFPKDDPHTWVLTVPSTKPRIYSGPMIRHFPSVTVVDDRKGHWRSVSLMSVDSGKSVRKSTRDLLEAVKANETQELQKLLGTPEVSTTEGEDM